MVSRVTNMVLNSDNAIRIAKRIMKDRNMRITGSFTPVVSEHTVQINPQKRIKLILSDTEFKMFEEQKHNDNWASKLTYMCSGTRNKVENCFMQFVSSIANLTK